MSLAAQVSAALTRIGVEFKSTRLDIASKYTLPGSGLPLTDLPTDTQKMLKAAIRWEQEILVQSGVRVTGYGPAPLGIYIPYAIRIKGIRYQFETATTTGATQGNLILSKATSIEGAQMNVAAEALTQTVTGLDIAISAGSRLSLNTTSIGSGTVGKGIYMSLYGEYDLAGVTL